MVELVTGEKIPLIADLVRYMPSVQALLYATLWFMHRTLPARPMGWKRLWPGIVTSILIWGLLATAMSIYVALTPTYSVTYGALSGVIVTLLFFYLTGVAIIFGAEVNATINFGLPPLKGGPMRSTKKARRVQMLVFGGVLLVDGGGTVRLSGAGCHRVLQVAVGDPSKGSSPRRPTVCGSADMVVEGSVGTRRGRVTTFEVIGRRTLPVPIRTSRRSPAGSLPRRSGNRGRGLLARASVFECLARFSPSMTRATCRRKSPTR